MLEIASVVISLAITKTVFFFTTSGSTRHEYLHAPVTPSVGSSATMLSFVSPHANPGRVFVTARFNHTSVAPTYLLPNMLTVPPCSLPLPLILDNSKITSLCNTESNEKNHDSLKADTDSVTLSETSSNFSHAQTKLRERYHQ